MTDKIEKQTQALAAQLEKLNATKTDEEYLKELEVYHQMLKEADFSIESHTASKKKELTLADKVLAPQINKVTKQVNRFNKKLVKHNQKKRKQGI